MNREIKFRAWDKINKKIIIIQRISFEYNYITSYNFNISLKDIILMQYTGLKDKNGKEIYEGDIISTKPLFNGDRPYFTVEWGKNEHNKMTGWMQRNNITGVGVLDDSLIEQGEVIGNIYENPNLLS